MIKTDSASEHLRASDPILGAVIDRIGPLVDEAPTDDPFRALCRIIVGQQLSVAVVRAIWNRIETHFGDRFSPQAFVDESAENLRTLGLSKQKVSYLQSLAAHVTSGELRLSEIHSLPDDEIRREIVAVKGLGPWSADMFLMFHLQKPDVLATGDLGIQNAMRRFYELEARPTPAEMEKIAEAWRPFRSLACRYLWRGLDAAPVA